MAQTCDEINTALTAAYEAQARALEPGYTLDTGQGRQSVVPVDLDKIQTTIDRLEAKAEEMGCTQCQVLLTGSFQRHG